MTFQVNIIIGKIKASNPGRKLIIWITLLLSQHSILN